jgi:hypothetical protein
VPDAARMHRELDVGRWPGELGDERFAEGYWHAAHVDVIGLPDKFCRGLSCFLSVGERRLILSRLRDCTPILSP